MEVAGLVLGGIPLILYALDNYKRCLDPVTKGIWRYETTLSTIRMNVFIQQEQLDITLRGIGLIRPSKDKLAQRLQELYPTRCTEFLDIFSHLEDVVAELRDKLDVDIQGKPKWTEDSPERANWEWRRIKRGFGRREREALINELQYWNTALRNVFEKSEIPPWDVDPLVGDTILFNQKQCDMIRRHVTLLHEALSKTWDCSCPSHRINIRLCWHEEKATLSSGADAFSLAVSSPVIQPWKAVSAKVAKKENGASASLLGQPLPTPCHAKQPSFSTVALLQPARKVGFLLAFKKNKETASVTHCAAAACQPSGLKYAQPGTPQISCLCNYILNMENKPTGYIPCRSHDKEVCFEQSSFPQARVQSITIDEILAKQKIRRPANHLVLSRKERFALAAAAAWAILYLCGSPWVCTDWNWKDSMELLFDDSTAVGTSLVEHPTMSYVFPRQFNQQEQNSNPSQDMSEAQRYHSTQIRNKAVFGLGILLIELCLGTTFEELRLQAHGDTTSIPTDSTPEILDDLDVANQQVDRVYDDAGSSYGYAVQRCLRCEFPGKDTKKDFPFPEFRRDFYQGVVAPVQATFSRQLGIFSFTK